MGKGLTGWLTPAGKFIACEYGEHGAAAEKIMGSLGGHLSAERRLREENGYIPMGSYAKCANMAYIHIVEATDEQLRWLERHKDQFDQEQLHLYLAWRKLRFGEEVS